ncbi:hypothetical protein HMN09_00961100 [Mycena chlorophos]|uniref:Uncharacterized protein n=1 Tax=Mycena chlorophos TaxID=658473 RepID=A0A8H6W539_MYCCL|nr:hypothetical protein HMN09_00961100 [Mycena chlorophos]
MPVLPPELEAYIIVNHVEDRASLRACALVCSRLCYWAQSRLFAAITTYFDWGCKLSWAQRAKRLIGILDKSPHLLLHVRSLVVMECSPALLVVLATQAWKALDSLELQMIPHPSEEVVLNMERLISGPPLQALRLEFDDESWNSLYFSRILAHCSATLANLDISNCSGSTNDPPLPLPSTVNTGVRRAHIQRLRLIGSSAAVAALDADILPLDFTHLHEVVYSESPHPSLHSLLRRSKAHLSLKVDPKDPTLTSFDFSLPMLHTLECAFTASTAWNIIPRIPHTNCLTTLTLTTSISEWDEFPYPHQNIGEQLDNQLVEHFHCLRVVRVEVKPPNTQFRTPFFEEEITTTELILAIQQALPKLTNAGMVSIIFHGWFSSA